MQNAEPLPPNQIATDRWPIIGERIPEPFDPATWRLTVTGLVARPLSLTIDDLRALPHVERRGTIHCVTRWSRAGIGFRGVALSVILDAAGASAEAAFVRFVSGRGHDSSLPIGVARDDILVADGVTEEGTACEIPGEHGGPVRSVTFARYFYKSVKWLREIEVMVEDRLGFWERTAGYHNIGDPWKEERYVARNVTAAALRAMLARRDFSGADLLSADLRGLDLSGARFVGASLRNVELTGGNLRGADLTNANLTNARLAGADLSGATIEGLDLDGTDLRRADLRGARGTPSSLAVAQFHSTATDGAKVAGLDWSAARIDGLLSHEEAWLRAAGVRLPARSPFGNGAADS